MQDASALVDRRLIDIMFNKFNLAKHCDAMRRYVLLGQGDFVQALMDMVGERARGGRTTVALACTGGTVLPTCSVNINTALWIFLHYQPFIQAFILCCASWLAAPPSLLQAQDDLGQEASAVTEISLNHAVRQAISASNAKYDDEDVIDRVRARKNKAFGG